MDLGIKGRTALVTGGSQGIGRAIAEQLLKEGASVMICGRDETRLAQTRSELIELGPVAATVTNVRRRDEIERLVAATVERFGPVDILVNNAGGASNLGGYDDLTEEDWVEVFETNLMAVVNASNAVIPAMRERGWGRIVNIGSENSVQPDGDIFPHYSSQKAAALSVTKSMSKALARTGVLVNAVSPAFVKTPLIESMLADNAARAGTTPEEAEQAFLAEYRPNITAGRASDPEETAKIVAVFCSEIASFVNGSNVRVDSGSVATIG